MSLGGLVRRTPAVLRRKFGSTAWLRFLSSDSKAMPAWATVNPYAMSGQQPAKSYNLVAGEWTEAKTTRSIIDPLNGEKYLEIPETSVEELQPFIDGMLSCPRSGLHNPMRNVERYVMLGDICARVAEEMGKPEVEHYFTQLLQRSVGKHWEQCRGEVVTVRKWFHSFSGDNVRNLARSFGLPGDRLGQETRGYRFPFGGVSVITPFNFPLEIPAIQALSALFMGNRPLVKIDEKVQVVFEQMVRLLHHCGLPKADMDLLWSTGPVCMEVLKKGNCRMTLFTGSQAVANLLTVELNGKVKLEDAGFDWKILGPDVLDMDYVAWQSDQDAYGYTGQKCSAQSIVFMHQNWSKDGFVEKIKKLAERRSLEDMTLGPIFTWTNEKIQEHIKQVLSIPGSSLVFGGKELEGHSIPDCYGAFEPTAIYVPLEEMLKPEYYELATKELFGPFQIITEYDDSSVDKVLEACERMENMLTAAIVSNDSEFVTKVLGSTVNGTTYAGVKARTTGAPQNHWFGPSGDPRSAGIHTPEAIKLVWSGHREIIYDTGRAGDDWSTPSAS
mmetsp:Transcript_10061/g.18301  ORF Transcript_10061/g.18301 Transcript_10061/m.18301 type:complete len:556 (-) Transcript_10061:239-1906(-)|eukprot:CAMPEP_0197524134 /NCGR_PEP_ID=MMETSP1318-20131121/8891_1 /TAXON_ID=552666 /ORGANISM="Partenskyella glossopodia, Strain RCC365" /LENGTH=555 /DNA_ID=CAMNT_0043077015 /DNA_START=85 /DNA_END=1752 /DNA_ORIENTATION=-